MSKFIIVGDVHLGKGTSIGKPAIGSTINSRISDQFNLLDWILDTTIEKNISDIVITGDIFEDVKPEFNIVSYFINWLKACDHNGIHVHIVMGNHDIKRSGSHYYSVLNLIESAEFTNTRVYNSFYTLFLDTTAITFAPFRDRRSLNLDSNQAALDKISSYIKYELANIPDHYDKIMIGHYALAGSLPIGDEFDDNANELMLPLEMFNEYNYTWMGHVHRPQVLSKSPYIAHIGSLNISDFGETTQSKILIEFDSESKDKFTEIKVPTRPLRIIKLDVKEGEDATDLLLLELENTELQQSLKDSIVKIEIKLNGSSITNINRQSVYNALRKYNIHHLAALVESRITRVVPLEKKSEVDNSISPKNALSLWASDSLRVDEEDKDMFLEIAYSILDEVKT